MNFHGDLSFGSSDLPKTFVPQSSCVLEIELAVADSVLIGHAATLESPLIKFSVTIKAFL